MTPSAALLSEALAIVSSQRGREARARHRDLLARAVAEADRALPEATGAARTAEALVLARAHAARAEDALHGANQLSLSAQRAPSAAECDDGWRKVAELAAAARAAARSADAAAALLTEPPRRLRAATDAARRAARAAAAADALLGARNHAYVFHTAPGFSFGEGWHLAAAALLGGVTLQVEPGQAHTAQAERFLRDAGLGAHVRPPRPRPRAAKQVTEVVARALRADPRGGQAAIRAAFLGGAPPPDDVRAFVDARAAGARGPKVLLWVRRGTHHPGRNTTPDEVDALARSVLARGARPILIGDAPFGPVPEGALDLTRFFAEPPFCGEGGRRAQLQLFEHLRAAHRVVGQLGVTTAGMDGPALLGLPTMYLTDATNPRMRAWVGALPGYVEVVRDAGYLDGIGAALAAWVAEGRGAP